MKKTLLSMLAGVAIVNTANADISVDRMRERCLKHPDKWVWVEQTHRCVDINPCKSDDPIEVDAYCNKTFADVQVGEPMVAHKLVYKYLRHVTGIRDYRTVEDVFEKRSWFGQDYYGYTLPGGGYVVFEFDDTTDITNKDVRDGTMVALCSHVYGGTLGKQDTSKSFECGGVTENICETIATDLEDWNFDLWGGQYPIVNWQYSEEDGVCSVYFKYDR